MHVLKQLHISMASRLGFYSAIYLSRKLASNSKKTLRWKILASSNKANKHTQWWILITSSLFLYDETIFWEVIVVNCNLNEVSLIQTVDPNQLCLLSRTTVLLNSRWLVSRQSAIMGVVGHFLADGHVWTGIFLQFVFNSISNNYVFQPLHQDI